MSLEEQATRLRALFRSGADKFQSFFTVLEEVRREVGDEALPNWCLNKLHIGYSEINRVAGVLTRAEEERVRRDLQASREADQRQREERTRQRELDREAHRRRVEEERLAADRSRVERERLVRHQRTVDRQRERRQNDPRERGPRAAVSRRGREITQNISRSDTDELSTRFERAQEMARKGLETAERGIDRWIEGSIRMAKVLCEARDRFSSDKEFGSWCERNIDVSKDDRAALINLGRLGDNALREVFSNSTSRSYQLIWRANKTLTVIEGGSVS